MLDKRRSLRDISNLQVLHFTLPVLRSCQLKLAEF